MKKYSAIYYTCFWLLILGAFASMAQYSYGLKICGLACLGFIFTFLHEIIFRRPGIPAENFIFRVGYAELSSLLMVAFVYMLRNFSIDFLLAIPMQLLLLFFLLCMQVYFAIREIRFAKIKRRHLVFALTFYYGAVFLFLISLLVVVILPVIGAVLTTLALVFAAVYVIATYRQQKKPNVNNEVTSAWQYVGGLKNRSVVIFAAGVLLCGYNLLYFVGAIPPLYVGTMPEGYQRLVEQSVTKQEAERAGEFKIRYEDFVQRHVE